MVENIGLLMFVYLAVSASGRTVPLHLNGICVGLYNHNRDEINPWS